jgi:cell fate regulator YaaT (PSP1 superfamily)
MVTVTGVRFKPSGKVYYFDPGDLELTEGEFVIVETARGLEFGEVMTAPCSVGEQSIVQPLKKVVRIADEKDRTRHEQNMKRKKSTLETCQQKIDSRGLDMKLIDVEFTFDNSKVIFYFTADGRVDFRELVKDLASVFKMRIELRQIGVRDEAKMLGGIGNCGKGLCCHTWLPDFEPVSIKMAKVQGLSLNPTKISGICGRLMCCLKYENEAYLDLKRGLPEAGERVRTPDGVAVVVENNVLREQVKVRLVLPPDKNTPQGEERLDADISVYKKKDVKRLDKKKKKQTDDDDLDSLPDEVRSLLED